MQPQLAIVLKGYPRLSETFIAQEIRALELRGYELCIFSLRHPYDPATHPIHDEIEAPVTYLPEYVHNDVMRVLRAWWRLRKTSGYRQARRSLMRDFRHDPTRNRLRRFAQALVMANEMPGSVRHYYSHFMHTPASVTDYASQIRQQSWSVSAHAKDIWTIPEWELRQKLESIDWVVTCTAANEKYLAGLSPDREKVNLLYHGLDFNRFDTNQSGQSMRDGSSVEKQVQLISVGRAVDKKGYEILLQALANLDADIHWQFIHIGGGELLDKLKKQAAELGLDSRIEWLGALPQTRVLECYREADLFVLPSKISDDGDRDGLPNVLMEAQSQRLACLSTNISGIPELIRHAETGWLVEQKSSEQLSEALTRLIGDPDLRRSLAQAGFERVREQFSMERGIDCLVELLNQSMDVDQRS
jgi:glycosyltransferase involved in cell wall biosynthesis